MRVRVPHLRRAAGREGGWGPKTMDECGKRIAKKQAFRLYCEACGGFVRGVHRATPPAHPLSSLGRAARLPLRWGS